MIKGTFILPHPPILIDEIGKDDVKNCLDVKNAFKVVGEKIKKLKPQTILIITPHGPVFSDGLAISYDGFLEGNLNKFGFDNIGYHKKNNVHLVDRIIYETGKIDVPCLKLTDENATYFNIDKSLDHGTIIPMKFIEEFYDDYELVHITYGLFSSEKLYEIGMTIKDAINGLNEDVVVISSGDLSHCLSQEGPYPYHPSGEVFDATVKSLLIQKEIEAFIAMPEKLKSEASECGKRSIDMMLGTLDGYDFQVTEYAYEKPFGVGYLVMGFENLEEDASKCRFKEILEVAQEEIKASIKRESRFVTLARNAILNYLNLSDTIFDDRLTKEMLDVQAGVFVSLKKNGALRGCMGTIGPTEENVALEIVSNAIKAAFQDPRFPAVEVGELDEIKISVDVIHTPEEIKSMDALDVKKYGIIVTSDYKRGVLLPDLEGIDTVEEQLRIACQKGQISDQDKKVIERFEVSRYY
jgi:AmmeMemoRadiSam system protein A